MDVNSIMNTYNLNSLWNNISPYASSSSSNIPMTGNVDSTVQQEYSAASFFGQTISNERQTIFHHVEPTYGIPLTYGPSGNLTIPSNIILQSNTSSSADSSLISLLRNNNSTEATSNENILSQYTSIENGTYKSSLSSILSSNPYEMYNAVSSLSVASTNNGSSSLDQIV